MDSRDRTKYVSLNDLVEFRPNLWVIDYVLIEKMEFIHQHLE